MSLLPSIQTATRRTALAIALVCAAAGSAQAQPKQNWQNLDLNTDSVFGISTERAYTELLSKKPATKVLVAVIDVGTDTTHEALQGILWHNPKEVAGNGKDDDKNGYVDDVMGWNFMDDPKGDSTKTAASIPTADLNPILQAVVAAASAQAAKNAADSAGPIHHDGRFYGSTNIVGQDPSHGTHVAGIIGASRTKEFKVRGVADAVSIMTVRAVPPAADETDDDVANSIRYAVDNGARVVNMSFGKAFATNKKAVDDAVKYAMSKDVLLVHAAGNDARNRDTDTVQFYPNRVYADGNGSAAAWIEVGASGSRNKETLVAPFSNYGKTVVDVFAPGVNITSSTPGGYSSFSGTSMAAPVVSGLAALIRSRYPKLTAIQVKEIIMKSVVKVDHPVNTPAGKSVEFSEVCLSGGIVNAYNALKLAATYK